MHRYNLYGDLLFESIKVIGSQPQFLDKHFARLMRGAKLLNFEITELSFEVFEREILTAIEKFILLNLSYSNMLRVRFVLYRDAMGNYVPDSNKTGFYAEVFNFEPIEILTPLIVGFYNTYSKAPGLLSTMKTGNALISVLAGIDAKEKGFDDNLISNTNGHIIEATSSNIFWLDQNQWYTPPIADGCVAGIMREVFMEQQSVEEKKCLITDLMHADKRLMSNALQGMREFELRI